MSQELIVRAEMEGLKWWGKLSAPEQRTVLVETQSLADALGNEQIARLAQGRHLSALQAILEPKRIFVRYLQKYYRRSKATAYRLIAEYQATKDKLPEVVLRTAIAHGFDQVPAAIVERMPPPKTQNRAKIVKYLEKVNAVRKQERSAALEERTYDPETLKREAFNFIELRYNRLPEDAKLRRRWVLDLDGMLLSLAGVTKSQSVTPMAIPEGWKVLRGRPPLKRRVA